MDRPQVDSTGHSKRGLRHGERGLDKIVSEVLGDVRVVDPGLQDAVVTACRDFWPGLDDGDVLVGGYRAGTLNLLLDSHARLAEAKNFVGDAIRNRINEILASRIDSRETGLPGTEKSKSMAHAKSVAIPPRKQREGNYVTRIHFYLRGTK